MRLSATEASGDQPHGIGRRHRFATAQGCDTEENLTQSDSWRQKHLMHDSRHATMLERTTAEPQKALALLAGTRKFGLDFERLSPEDPSACSVACTSHKTHNHGSHERVGCRSAHLTVFVASRCGFCGQYLALLTSPSWLISCVACGAETQRRSGPPHN